jgi:hypothetical protein
MPYMISTHISIFGPAARFVEKVGAVPLTIPLQLVSLMYGWMSLHIGNIIA